MPNKVSFFAPGKLFIAGEYAVTENLGEAIIMPVKKGINVTIQSHKINTIVNLQYPSENMTFETINEIKNPYNRNLIPETLFKDIRSLIRIGRILKININLNF